MFYIATNGASCAISRVDFPSQPEVIPRPRCLIGFATLKEAEQAQRICLNEPIPEVTRMMRQWADDPAVTYIVNENPEPATGGTTIWVARKENDAAVREMRDEMAKMADGTTDVIPQRVIDRFLGGGQENYAVTTT
jgi:hypothetical protein